MNWSRALERLEEYVASMGAAPADACLLAANEEQARALAAVAMLLLPRRPQDAELHRRCCDSRCWRASHLFWSSRPARFAPASRDALARELERARREARVQMERDVAKQLRREARVQKEQEGRDAEARRREEARRVGLRP